MYGVSIGVNRNKLYARHAEGSTHQELPQLDESLIRERVQIDAELSSYCENNS